MPTKTPKNKYYAFLISGATGNRTRDTGIFSPLLYRLSYGTNFSFANAKIEVFLQLQNNHDKKTCCKAQFIGFYVK